jgi:hypothetical protein
MTSSEINLIFVLEAVSVDSFIKEKAVRGKLLADKFLSIKIFDDSDLTNGDKIKSLYTKEELETALSGSSIIKAGTMVGLPNSLVKRDSSVTIPSEAIQSTDFNAFMNGQLKRLFADPNYYSSIKNNDGSKIGRVDINDFTVYAWIRAASDPGKESGGNWYDISSFVETIQISVTKSGGSFNFNLTPITCQFDENSGWSRSNNFNAFDNEILSSTIISKYKQPKTDDFLSRNDFFFEKVLQENDLIFIRFEGLAMEEAKLSKNQSFSESDIPGKVYDMIGLIDQVSTSTSDRNVNVSVQGRDLMKVLIEDGSYFFPEAFAQNIFANDTLLAKRNLMLAYENQLIQVSHTFKTIETILKYIFNKFSNIGYVPNSALRGYGSDAIRSKYNLKQSLLVREDATVFEKIDANFNTEDRQGVWQIIDLVLDPKASKRVLVDTTFGQDNGSIINTIRKLCQDPFVEFYGDTYGDRYNFIVKKPPFDAKGYKGMVYGNVVTEDILKEGLSSNDKLRPDQISRELSERANSGRNFGISELVVDIDESEVFADNLSYSNEVYSWYRVIPRTVAGTDLQAFKLSPIIPVDEYAKIWGNRMYSIEYNYCPVEFIDDVDANNSLGFLERQCFLDLQYVLQSHIYLPFTRQGTIKIMGNRTIKMGTFIYYKPTDEIFYVDAVSNTRTINERSTTLKVSRGMREKYIKGVDVKFESGVKKVSYFNIMPTAIENNASINNLDFLKNWKVDKDVMNFFLQRRQWA